MKIRKTKLIIVLIVCLFLIISFTTSNYASTSITSEVVAVPTNGSLPGDDISEAYCVEPGDAYRIRSSN